MAVNLNREKKHAVKEADQTAIIGGGLTGLYLAWRLARQGQSVTVFEKEQVLGGLAASFQVQGTPLEHFYHHVFPSHHELIALIGELHLGDRLYFRHAPMATCSQGKLYPFNSARDLLRFTPLSLPARLRLGFALAILLSQRGWRKFDAMAAADLLTRLCGRKGYQQFWEPLLRQKFGELAPQVAATWLWDRLHSRSKPTIGRPAGSLGYLKGGMHVLISALQREILALGGEIRTGCIVQQISQQPGGVSFHLDSGETIRGIFPRCVVTLPTPQFLSLATELPQPYRQNLMSIPHVHSLCLILRLRRSLSPYYWINMADPACPFAVVVEHTHLADPDQYGSGHIIYLSRYLADRKDPLWQAADDTLLETVYPQLQRLFPDLAPADILELDIFRASDSQPVFQTGYSTRIPPFATPWPGLFLLNSSQLYPHSRCLNTSLILTDRFLQSESQQGQKK